MINPEHRGLKAVAAGDAIKALLMPLEPVCRYREKRGDDTASFEVRPGNRQALPFSVSIAPGGINLESEVLTIKEIAIEQFEIVTGIVDSILAGRVRQVRQLKANGSVRVTKAYVFDQDGRLVFKNRKSAALAGLSRTAKTERVRFSAYT
jgi:hypothetical protein